MRKMDKKTAILAVSFGSTHTDTIEKCITQTERKIQQSFPEYPLYRAFLSPRIIQRLKQNHGITVDSVEEALQKMRKDGCQRVAVLPTLLLEGIEYDLLMRKLEKEEKLEYAIARPLLVTEEDCEVLASIIMEENPIRDREALVLMGHGTAHEANQVYMYMQDVFKKRQYPCVMATVEGIPSFSDAVSTLEKSDVSSVKLLPLMFVAGEHAKQDMTNAPESLQRQIEDKNVIAAPIIRGLGESEKVRELFVQRMYEALEKFNISR